MRRALSRQSPAGFRALLRSLPWLLAALLPGPLACSPAGPGADVWPPASADDIPALRERDDLNLVFVVVDTLRADHLGAYGYERDTSPVMD